MTIRRLQFNRIDGVSLEESLALRCDGARRMTPAFASAVKGLRGAPIKRGLHPNHIALVGASTAPTSEGAEVDKQSLRHWCPPAAYTATVTWIPPS